MGITNWQKSKDFLNAIGVNAIDVPKDIFQSLKEIGLKSKTVKYNKNLVGHIKEEYEILNYTPDIKNFIEKQVSANPVYANINRKYNANKHSSPIVLDRIWINFQNKYEFNPLHDHSGCASFIIFVTETEFNWILVFLFKRSFSKILSKFLLLLFNIFIIL